MEGGEAEMEVERSLNVSCTVSGTPAGKETCQMMIIIINHDMRFINTNESILL